MPYLAHHSAIQSRAAGLAASGETLSVVHVDFVLAFGVPSDRGPS
jgi:hypothetical protein